MFGQQLEQRALLLDLETLEQNWFRIGTSERWEGLIRYRQAGEAGAQRGEGERSRKGGLR